MRLDLDGGSVLFTDRHGGVSEAPYASLNLGLWTDDDPGAVAANRERVRALAGGAALAQGRQVHGTRVVVDQTAVDADGQVTTRRGVAPIVLVADCLPIALVAPEAIGVLHAGWRGLAGGIVAEGVATLRRAGADERITAAIGPGARACCYAVGDELRAAFGTSDPTLDLPAIAAGQLAAAGVHEVHDTGLCTICARDERGPRFFSHRRDGGVTGRQAGLAWRS